MAREVPALVVRNTFLDNDSTAGGLLADGDRQALLVQRGKGRAKTWSLAVPMDGSTSPSASSCGDGAGEFGEAVEAGDDEGVMPNVLRSSTWPCYVHPTIAAPSAREVMIPGDPVVLPLRLAIAPDLGLAAHRGSIVVMDGEIPNVGSQGHAMRECKPCAFLDSRKGCVAGADCTYCHLCEPGEKKRRQKEKRKAIRDRRRELDAMVAQGGA